MTRSREFGVKTNVKRKLLREEKTSHFVSFGIYLITFRMLLQKFENEFTSTNKRLIQTIDKV
jgi:hypothetical protein